MTLLLRSTFLYRKGLNCATCTTISNLTRRKTIATNCLRLFSSAKSFDNELEVSENFVNRNPCNLENMLLAYKPAGYELEAQSCRFWYKLEYVTAGRFLEGHVIHHSGRTVVSASTKEHAIQNQLFSTDDYSAAKNLGRILAERCLECGITFVSYEPEEGDEKRIAKKAFVESMETGGVQLNELEPYKHLGVNEVYKK